jgi:Zn-dependent oligopeptidase
MQTIVPYSGPGDRYDYAALTADIVRRTADEALAQADALVNAAVAAVAPRTYENTLAPLALAANVVTRADGVGTYIGYIHPDEAVRDASADMEERTERWRKGLARRDDLAAAILEYAATDDARVLDGGRRRMLELWASDVRRAGHELAPEARAEFTRLRERISELCITFGRNIGELADEIPLGRDDLEGLSDTLLAQLPAGPEPGSRTLPVTLSLVWPFIEQSTRRDLRELALRRYLSRAAEPNAALLQEIVDLRRRTAGLLGRDSWSEFANEARMSGGRAEVMAFIDGLRGPLGELAATEQAAMREVLGEEGIRDELQAWDWPYVNERQRRSMGLDFGELASYFPLDAVLAGLFDILREVFGVRVERVPDASVWHPDVRLYSLMDDVSGEHLAVVYLDLFVREGKRPGGWQVNLVNPVNRPGKARLPAVCSLVLNFAPSRDGGPSLLHHEDVLAIFHEFGHVLEFGLSRSEGAIADETSLELDFVEAPSQIMEHWAWSPDVLGRFARHYETGAPPPSALLERLAASRTLNLATHTLWNFLYRSFVDQYLHGPEPIEVVEAYRQGFAVTRFPFPEGTCQPASFGHIASMYDAGFYSYIWAQVFGDDMFSAFADGGLLSPEVGRRYRETVIEPSWSVPGRQRVEHFLGRPASDRAFLERLGIAGERARS